MNTIKALNGEEEVGSYKSNHDLVVLRSDEYPSDVVALETEDDKVILDLFLIDLVGCFTDLQLQPDKTLAVLFDVKLKTAVEIKDSLLLKGDVGVELLRNPARQLLHEFGAK